MRNIAVAVAVAVVASAVLPQASVVHAADFRCSGAQRPGLVVDNLVVPQGAICGLENATVRGNLKVEEGGSLGGRGVDVWGNFQANGFGLVDLNNSLIRANIELKNGSSVFFDDVFVGGNVVDGNFLVEGVSGYIDVDGGNTFNGNVDLLKNRGIIIFGRNQVRGNVKVAENVGGVTLTNNTIRGKLECEKNVPPPAGGNNRAGRKQGQCAAL